MKRIAIAVLATLCLAGPAAARNEVFHVPLADVVEGKSTWGSVQIQFGTAPATGYQVIGEYVAAERSHFHGSEEDTCKARFAEALDDLAKHAEHAGANAVIGIVSFYRDTTFSSTTQFECHGGSNGDFVTLKGTFARTQ